jgi:hypothetical protein
MATVLAAALHEPVIGNRERCTCEHAFDVRAPRHANRGEICAEAACEHVIVDRIGGEQLAGKRPRRIDRRLHPHVAEVGAVAQSRHPIAAAPHVIGNFAHRLVRDRGNLRIVRVPELLQHRMMPHVE